MSDRREGTHSVLELSELLQLPEESAYILGPGGELIASAGAGPLPDQPVREVITAIGRDADRATRHLGFAGWDGVVIEGTRGLLGIGRVGIGDQRLAVVTCPARTPVGRVQRLATRVAALELGS